MKGIILAFLSCISLMSFGQHNASTVKENSKAFKTYPFSDPDPVARMGAIYPYFRFDGYSDKPIDKAWKVVELENEFIQVMILPEIGGKIWSAVEKSTGKPFIYYNHVVKFRDIAMRGPWTSGGIEANYGIIGHTPNCSTPVDYVTRTNDDGSVSCFIGTLDLLTQTYWTIEVNLPKDKAYFTTRSFWSNTTPMEQPYYTWMNAGIQAAGNLEFVYPGNQYLTHDGEAKAWKVNPENNRDISFYENNNFGQYKSYHVFGKYTDFFGGFWHHDNFGMGRYAAHDEKAGKKIWIWGLSQQGMIWEKLLTDTDGQYVEVQSGRLFNQTAESSTFTPFEHRGFAPFSSDTWIEYWFPVKGTDGFVKANPYGALNVRVNKGFLRVDFSPLQDMQEKLTITEGQNTLFSKVVELKTLKPFSDSVAFHGNSENIKVELGDHLLEFRTDPNDGALSRPAVSPSGFDWNSLQGLYLQGKEHVRERNYQKAMDKLQETLAKDPHFLPALTEMAMLLYRNMEYEKSREHALHALSIDTYNPAANFYYGLANVRLNKLTDARDGFDIAAMSPEYRTAAYTELSRISLIDRNYDQAERYARRSLETNSANVEALQLLVVSFRIRNDHAMANKTLATLKGLNPLNHFPAFEEYFMNSTASAKSAFIAGIRNELVAETYLELAAWYYRIGLLKEVQVVLSLAPANAEVLHWIAFLEDRTGAPTAAASLTRALNSSVELVFPFRPESAEVFEWAIGATQSWKPRYLLGLIFWNRNQLTRAQELFSSLGNSPDFAPFYAARAELIHATRLADLQKAAVLDPKQWRYGKLLAQHHIQEKDLSNALQVATDYSKRFSTDFRIRLLLAKIQLLNKNYIACSETLDKTNVLPFEGSTEGRVLYHEAWIMQAIEKIRANKYADALKMIAKASAWPANLGVGKPYDADIDWRVENYLEGLCYEGMKDKVKAKAKWEEVIISQHKTFGANDLITAWGFKKTGQPEKGDVLLRRWMSSEPKNASAVWCLEAYRNDVHATVPAEDESGRVLQAIYLLNR